jgi:acetylornithine deacetylase/succinyl-diaminopimelate desuccinylase-like protein
MINQDAPAVCSEEVQAAVRASAQQLGLTTKPLVRGALPPGCRLLLPACCCRPDVSWTPACRASCHLQLARRPHPHASQHPHTRTTQVSRAYHDSLFMARLAPTGMIFIPCRGGWSHRPDEFASQRDVTNGVGVLALTMARLSGGSFPGKTEL